MTQEEQLPQQIGIQSNSGGDIHIEQSQVHIAGRDLHVHMEQGLVGEKGYNTGPFLAPPLPPHEIIGRDTMLRDLKQLLFTNKTLALTALDGLPGIGKTTLALALAHDLEVKHHFSDGVLWAGLGKPAQEADVLSHLGTWGTALGISASELEKLPDLRSRQQRIQATIGQRKMLLIADDVWKVELALHLRLGGDNCAYLVTTRLPIIAEQLTVEGGVTVRELSREDSLILLKQFAPEAIQDAPDKVLALVQAVGGLPLALTLIGKHLQTQLSRQLTPQQRRRHLHTTLDQLNRAKERFKLEQPQAGLEHHPSFPSGIPLSLMASIDLSYRALGREARRLLRALSIFPAKPNSFSEEAALTVATATAETLDMLTYAGLVESSGQDRHMLHQTIVDYMKSKRRDGAVEIHMVEYFADYVEKHKIDYKMLDEEANNILAALQIAYERRMQAALVRGVLALAPFLLRRGLHISAVQQLQMAYDAATVLGDIQSQVPLLLYLGDIEERLGHYEQAEVYLQNGLHLAREQGDRKRICGMLRNLGKVSVQFRGYEQAEAYYQEGLALARQISDPEEISAFLINMGTLAKTLGDFIRAEGYQQEALALARQIGKDEWIIVLLLNQGTLVGAREGQAQAEPYWREGLALAREQGYRQWTVIFLVNLGGAAIVKGDNDQAEAYLQEGLHLARQLGHLEQESSMLGNLGELARSRKDYTQAERYLQEGLARAKHLGKGELICEVLALRGDLSLDQQLYERAEATFHEMLSLIPGGNRALIALAHYGLARAAFALGRVDQARCYAEKSAVTFEAIGHSEAISVREWLRALPTGETNDSQEGDRLDAIE